MADSVGIENSRDTLKEATGDAIKNFEVVRDVVDNVNEEVTIDDALLVSRADAAEGFDIVSGPVASVNEGLISDDNGDTIEYFEVVTDTVDTFKVGCTSDDVLEETIRDLSE